MVVRRRIDKVGCCGYSARMHVFKQVVVTLCRQQVTGFITDVVLIKLCCRVIQHQYSRPQTVGVPPCAIYKPVGQVAMFNAAVV